VPVDDFNTLSVTWAFTRVPSDREPYVQGRIPAWHGPVKDLETGRWISSHVMNQDFVAWIGQGTIADRTQEHLGTGDRGVILLRQRFLDDLTAIERGEDPKGIIRDPAANVAVPLPIAERRFLTESLSREELLRHPVLGKQYEGEYPFQAGQPEEVRREYAEAMGIG
jgi:5,5'-dehydrodivanillate O-demethylase